MKNNIIKELLNQKLIVIVRGIDRKQLLNVAQAVYDGGIRFLEITYSADGSVSDEDTAENIKLLCEHFAGKMHIGAGTVLTEKQVEYTKAAGGEFIISPDTNLDVIKKTIELDMVSIPGALTPTEIQQAHLAGADFVKLFPITSLGVNYVKAVKAPLTHIRLLAVGGVTAENMLDYLGAGVCGFGIGTNIIDKKLIEQEDYVGITELAKKYVVGVV